jgi:hypothetical protein
MKWLVAGLAAVVLIAAGLGLQQPFAHWLEVRHLCQQLHEDETKEPSGA